MGIDWAHFKNYRALGLVIGNFANEMTALYVADDPETLQFTDLASVYGLGAPTQPPLTFGLFFFDYDLDGRPDLLSANGHLERDIARVQAGQGRPVPPAGRPRLRLRRLRRRRRPRRRPDGQRPAGAPLPQRRRGWKPLDPPGADGTVLQPRRHRRKGCCPGRQPGAASAARGLRSAYARASA